MTSRRSGTAVATTAVPRTGSDGTWQRPRGALRRDKQAIIASLNFGKTTATAEAEAVTIQGMVGSFATKAEDVGNPAVEDIEISQLGAALETEYKLAKDKLVVGLDAGYASGDDYPRWGLRPGTGQVAAGDRETGDTRQFGCPVGTETNTANPCSAALDKNITNFRFDPSYRGSDPVSRGHRWDHRRAVRQTAPRLCAQPSLQAQSSGDLWSGGSRPEHPGRRDAAGARV